MLAKLVNLCFIEHMGADLPTFKFELLIFDNYLVKKIETSAELVETSAENLKLVLDSVGLFLHFNLFFTFSF